MYNIDFEYNKSSQFMNLALIQGSVPRSGLLFNEQKLEVLNFHSIETKKLLSESSADIDAIFWPENAIDVDPFKNAKAFDYIEEILTISQKPLLAGAVIQEENGLSNSVGLWNPKTFTIEQEYVKSILVPFGEYLPFRETLSKYIRRFDLIPQDFVPGNYPNNINLNNRIISPIICFEIAWNRTLNEQILNGGQLISVHTNNATYAFSNQIDQQFTMTRLRALEMGREVVVSATTGISAHLDRSGEAIWQSNEFVPQSKIVKVNLYSDITPAVKYSKEIGFVSLFGIVLPFILLLLRYGYRKL
jgi:apolipoprotein N-acyltransferase